MARMYEPGKPVRGTVADLRCCEKDEDGFLGLPINLTLADMIEKFKDSEPSTITFVGEWMEIHRPETDKEFEARMKKYRAEMKEFIAWKNNNLPENKLKERLSRAQKSVLKLEKELSKLKRKE